MKKLFHLTQSGIEELAAEKAALLERRVGTAEAIKVAREMGDLAENAEYQSALAEQQRIEARIDEIEHILANAAVIKAKKVSKFALVRPLRLHKSKKAVKRLRCKSSAP
jgi:transcription elongation factor GreA